MPNPSLHELVPLLQVSIGPVILISGVGLLLLSMTNRLAPIVDRARALRRAERHGEIDDLEILRRRFTILYRRSRLLRWAILLASVSLLVAVVVATFVGHEASAFLMPMAEGPVSGVLISLLTGGLLHVVLDHHHHDEHCEELRRPGWAALGAVVALSIFFLLPNTVPPVLQRGFRNMGYLFVEIPLMQRFILFAGHPVYSFSVVLFALLVFSGAGSLASHRLPWNWTLAAIGLVGFVYLWGIPLLFSILVGVSAGGATSPWRPPSRISSARGSRRSSRRTSRPSGSGPGPSFRSCARPPAIPAFGGKAW